MIVEREHKAPNKLSYKNITLAFFTFLLLVKTKRKKFTLKLICTLV